MAGGIGSRFWPMSQTERPKQFLDILGTGKTLIQQTVSRFKPLCPTENILIVTNEQYKSLVLEQLPDFSEEQILCEPARRNTAPCIAYANYKILTKNTDANVIVSPADHLILDEAEFLNIIKTGIAQTKHCECLVTLGIKPSRPDTGYGYIQFNDTPTAIGPNVRKVKTFTEKPSLEIANQFLESGDFYWNSGIFIWNIKSISNAFKQYLPDIDALFIEGVEKYYTSDEQEFINRIYGECQNISIDYGILEKAQNVFVILSDFGWSDLGTWGSLFTHIDKDQRENALIGDNIHMYDSNNCLVHVPKEKLVVLQGLDDYIIVESNDVLLVCKKQDEQKIKQFVADIKLKAHLQH